MAILDRIRGFFRSSEPKLRSHDLQKLSNSSVRAPAPSLSRYSAPSSPADSVNDYQKRLESYVSIYQHHALREAAFQMHPELLRGLESGEKHQLEFGLRHSWFKVPLKLGVQ